MLVIMARYFYPELLIGGGVTSVTNMAVVLSKHVDMTIFTRDVKNKYNSTTRFPPEAGVLKLVEYNAFNYMAGLARVLAGLPKKTFFFNSFYCFQGSIFPLIILRLLRIFGLYSKKIILAPRGELMAGPGSLKPIRKLIYRKFFKFFGLNEHVQWLASTQNEHASIVSSGLVHPKCKIYVAADFCTHIKKAKLKTEPYDGILRLCFISRIDRKKNIVEAVEALIHGYHSGVFNKKIIFDIYGPITDNNYFNDLVERISKPLPLGIDIRYKGALEPGDVHESLTKYQFLFLPTLDENFGYIIVEAGLSGCVPIISQNTPWGKIDEICAGYVINLDGRKIPLGSLEKIINEFEPRAYQEIRENSQRFFSNVVSNERLVDSYLQLIGVNDD